GDLGFPGSWAERPGRASSPRPAPSTARANRGATAPRQRVGVIVRYSFVPKGSRAVNPFRRAGGACANTGAPSAVQVELVQIDRQAVGPRDGHAELGPVEAARDPAYRAVADRDVEAVGEQAAELGQVLLRVVGQILGLRPGDGLARLDDHDGVRGPVQDLRKADLHLALEDGARTGEDLVVGRVRLLRVAVQRGVHGRYFLQEFLVVRAVPRLVQLELLVQLRLLDERQEGDAPAEQRLAVLAID